MEPWQSHLLEDLTAISRLNVHLLGKIIHVLDEKTRQKWVNTMKEEIHETCSLLVDEASSFVSIQYLRKGCMKLCAMLQIDMPYYDSAKLTLYEEKKLLDNYLKKFEKEIDDKQNKFKEMSFKQVKLCRLLEKIPITFVETTTPTNSELKKLSEEIIKLESEWQEIQNAFYETKTKIENVVKELNIEISPEISNIIAPVNNVPITITKDNLQHLTDYFKILEERQNQEERVHLESLEKVINDLYDTCHIAIPDRHVTKNINNHSLDEIQNEISKLKSYWQENEEIFLLFEDYNHHWMKLSKLVDESQKHNCVNKKVSSIKGLCGEIYQIEEKLISTVVQYETKHIKSFTTFGQTIPDVIAKLHDLFGKFTIKELNVEQTLSSIISNYGDTVKSPQCQNIQREIENVLISNDSYMSFEEELIGNEEIVGDEIESIREDSPLLVERRIKIEEPPTKGTDKTQPLPNEYQSRFDLNLPPTIGRESNINVNINNQETPVQVSIFLNTPSSSSTTLKIAKSRDFNRMKGEKRTPYQPMSNKHENMTASNRKMFKPKTIEAIQTALNDFIRR